ncbi:hypothetical protein RRG08_059416 [Elysia crispata]|uniref:Uncharacterized protein n=1 Tax=Elysia crispata TaxID=231223 RepID=A0AAE0YZT8_9GAST|nr:hypothetical protein RRG08_059416 [Elysia crispata]
MVSGSTRRDLMKNPSFITYLMEAAEIACSKSYVITNSNRSYGERIDGTLQLRSRSKHACLIWFQECQSGVNKMLSCFGYDGLNPVKRSTSLVTGCGDQPPVLPPPTALQISRSRYFTRFSFDRSKMKAASRDKQEIEVNTSISSDRSMSNDHLELTHFWVVAIIGS